MYNLFIDRAPAEMQLHCKKNLDVAALVGGYYTSGRKPLRSVLMSKIITLNNLYLAQIMNDNDFGFDGTKPIADLKVAPMLINNISIVIEV